MATTFSVICFLVGKLFFTFEHLCVDLPLAVPNSTCLGQLTTQIYLKSEKSWLLKQIALRARNDKKSEKLTLNRFTYAARQNKKPSSRSDFVRDIVF